MPARLLVMEDDDDVAGPLLRALAREGHAVERVASGAEGLSRVADGDIDLVLLDLGLPDMDGLEVCRLLRSSGYDGGVLMLTARSSELDRVDGLDVGADDYLAKPFGLAELHARTRAVLRRTARTAAPAPAAPVSPEGLRVDREARRTWVRDRELVLTGKEFDLLAHLCERRGTVVTREAVMDAVWDENWFGSTKTLDVTMARLRQKLDDAGLPGLITTVRGVGFRLDGNS
ncbi:response regulator transcription factor [Nocardioides jiangxiensis]|uniref:Response regulator transcription factor n=1 Tax=Nocardioides jiangxiensis TaxID=3064524 RepID=A0ABT9AYI3_9ACTN|nr:response regulator transcription factor [Nocardioides sp. WY-20]MDO7867636.1 response regulator transcription factor [Nocardioides sp. WY-20]